MLTFPDTLRTYIIVNIIPIWSSYNVPKKKKLKEFIFLHQYVIYTDVHIDHHRQKELLYKVKVSEKKLYFPAKLLGGFPGSSLVYKVKLIINPRIKERSSLL